MHFNKIKQFRLGERAGMDGVMKLVNYRTLADLLANFRYLQYVYIYGKMCDGGANETLAAYVVRNVKK